MIKNSIQSKLLQNFFEVLERHRAAFEQERVYWRAVGMIGGNWSSCYRLFAHRRYKEERVAESFVRETLPHTKPEESYVVGTDGVQIPHSSWKTPGTS